MAVERPPLGTLYANLQAELLLDDARVLVQKLMLQPGQSIYRHTPGDNELRVFITGGVLTSAAGRSTVWREGRVLWEGPGGGSDGAATNSGTASIEIVSVVLKPVAPTPNAASAANPKYQYLNYPNIPGEDLLENDYVIVQRFLVQAGQWEGVHAHHPDMLYIHIKGGHWAARSKSEPERAYPEPSPDGSVGWMPTIDISEGHESGNIGKNAIDLIWVTLKK
jgi:hypothetical protein